MKQVQDYPEPEVLRVGVSIIPISFRALSVSSCRLCFLARRLPLPRLWSILFAVIARM